MGPSERATWCIGWVFLLIKRPADYLGFEVDKTLDRWNIGVKLEKILDFYLFLNKISLGITSLFFSVSNGPLPHKHHVFMLLLINSLPVFLYALLVFFRVIRFIWSLCQEGRLERYSKLNLLISFFHRLFKPLRRANPLRFAVDISFFNWSLSKQGSFSQLFRPQNLAFNDTYFICVCFIVLHRERGTVSGVFFKNGSS